MFCQKNLSGFGVAQSRNTPLQRGWSSPIWWRGVAKKCSSSHGYLFGERAECGLSKCMRKTKKLSHRSPRASYASTRSPRPSLLTPTLGSCRFVVLYERGCRLNSFLPFAAWEVCSPCAGKGAASRQTRQRRLCLHLATKAVVVNHSPRGHVREERSRRER